MKRHLLDLIRDGTVYVYSDRHAATGQMNALNPIETHKRAVEQRREPPTARLTAALTYSPVLKSKNRMPTGRRRKVAAIDNWPQHTVNFFGDTYSTHNLPSLRELFEGRANVVQPTAAKASGFRSDGSPFRTRIIDS